jgi:hypothetical protein
MRKILPEKDNNRPDDTSADLARRLERYRSRVEAEGRKRSLEAINRAIRDVSGEGDTQA